MDKNKNYYGILGIDKNSDYKTIKKSYYKLSFEYHPDKNREADPNIFKEIKEAYEILSDTEIRKKYDTKSRYGNNYNELFDLVDSELDYNDIKSKADKFAKYEVNNIQITVGDTFNGKLEYERWIMCKSCEGSGKDLSSKIVIRNEKGKIIKKFDADNGCDFCEGTGKFNDLDCSFCNGLGKIGITPCKKCKGEKRLLGKQKINNVKLTGETTKIEAMGHYSREGRIGYLTIVKV